MLEWASCLKTAQKLQAHFVPVNSQALLKLARNLLETVILIFHTGLAAVETQ